MYIKILYHKKCKFNIDLKYILINYWINMRVLGNRNIHTNK